MRHGRGVTFDAVPFILQNDRFVGPKGAISLFGLRRTRRCIALGA